MNNLTENQTSLVSVVDQFLCAAAFLTRAAERSEPSKFGMDLAKAPLDSLAGQLREIIREISSSGFLGVSHQARINFIVQDALSIRRDIGNDAMRSIFFNCALGILTGNATAYSNDDIPAARIEAETPARQMHRISNTPEKLAA